MNDKTIRKICLILVIIGIVGMFIATTFIAPEAVKISGIGENNTGQIVSVSGIVSSYYTSQGHVFFEINDSTGAMKVIMFQKEAEGNPLVYDIGNGDKIAVNGKVQFYQNELEIVASVVKVI